MAHTRVSLDGRTGVATVTQYDETPEELANRALEASIVADVNTLGVLVDSLVAVRGKLGDVLPAARAKRESAATTDARLRELERQCEMLLKLQAARIRGLF